MRQDGVHWYGRHPDARSIRMSFHSILTHHPKLIPDDFSHERADRVRELERWKKLIESLEDKTDDFYGYFNNHYSGHSPTTAMRFKGMMG